MTTSPVVATSKGRVRGSLEDGIEVFLGIPYGAPTGGANRFRPPQPRAPWTDDLDCTAYGDTCPQTVLVTKMSDEMRALRVPAPGSAPPAPGEDCLVLNVWTPDADDGARRPVMVWFHGGGYTTGSGSVRANRGTRLAQRGDVVVVTINNRLGALGFLALGEIGGEEYADSGNAGLLDMVAALQWVHDEIEAFGGDPDNVTIFGCSGGGGKVTTLLGTPAAEGLFDKAIVESGPMLHGVEVEGATATRAVLGALGLDDSQVKALHDVPIPELIAATQSILPDTLQRLLVNGRGHHFGPVVDGRTLPAHMFDPVAAPSAVGVPLVIGTNKDEIALFAAMIGDFDDWDAQRHLDIVRAFAGDRYDDVLDAYSRTRPGASTADLAVAAMSAPTRASTITLSERKLAAGGDAPVFMYLFAFESDILGGRVKAGHGLEVPFVFDLTDEAPMTGSRPEKADVAAAMSTAWLAFARTGDPNHDGLPAWPRYDTTERATMVFDAECRVDDDPLPDERIVWAGVDIHMD